MKQRITVIKSLSKSIEVTYTLLKQNSSYTIIASSLDKLTNEVLAQDIRNLTEDYQRAKGIFDKICKYKVSVNHLIEVVYDLMC